MKDNQLLQHIRASLVTLAQSIEKMYCYTYQLDKFYLFIEDSEIYETSGQLEDCRNSLMKANDILSNYDYSAKPF
jgi:hypothetical protein